MEKAYVLHIGAIGIAGSIFGMPIDAILLGAVAGAIAHGRSGEYTRNQGILMVFFSALLAGGLSPLLVGYAVHTLNFGENEARTLMLQPALPILIGSNWPWAMGLIKQGVTSIFETFISRFTQNKFVSKEESGDKE